MKTKVIYFFLLCSIFLFNACGSDTKTKKSNSSTSSSYSTPTYYDSCTYYDDLTSSYWCSGGISDNSECQQICSSSASNTKCTYSTKTCTEQGYY